MTRPLVIDAFPFHDELDILEMRLTELYDAVDWFVLVEADRTHQDNPKPYHYLQNADRFERWADKIVPVQAVGLPSRTEFPDPWAREHAQREWIGQGLSEIGAGPDDIVLQSDVDEIPRALHARNVQPHGGFVAFGQRGHFWAVDWSYPHIWKGTVAGTVRSVERLGDRCWARMRDMRNVAPCPPHMMDAGWHFSWLGGPDRALHKVGAFCHPEVEKGIEAGIANHGLAALSEVEIQKACKMLAEDNSLLGHERIIRETGVSFWRDGVHVDGVKMEPVDVDEGWPKWVRDGNAPAGWYRPR